LKKNNLLVQRSFKVTLQTNKIYTGTLTASKVTQTDNEQLLISIL